MMRNRRISYADIVNDSIGDLSFCIVLFHPFADPSSERVIYLDIEGVLAITASAGAAASGGSWTMLIVFFCIAILVSFACSIFEAVLLSVSQPFVATMKKTHPVTGIRWEQLKSRIDGPLTSILTLNTIAHTVGSIGVGKEVAGLARDSGYAGWIEGLTAALMTLAVLVLSEIIPKTLGAKHWRKLAPSVGFLLEKLSWMMTPVIWFIRVFGGSGHGEAEFSREELKVMADIGHKVGKLQESESRILKNLLHMRENIVGDVMTPRVVVFSVPESTTVGSFVDQHEKSPFSRIPTYADTPDHVTGFVLRSEILLAASKNQIDTSLSELRRPIHSVSETLHLTAAFDHMVANRYHIARVVDDYGGLAGLVTLEDIVETLLGLEIVDEADTKTDMRAFARSQWEKRARMVGLSSDQTALPKQTESAPVRAPTSD